MGWYEPVGRRYDELLNPARFSLELRHFYAI